MKALRGAGFLASRQRAYEKAMALHEASFALAQEVGDQIGIMRALTQRGSVFLLQNNLGAAQARFEESLELSRTLGDTWWTAIVLAQLGTVARLKGNSAKAVELCEESLGLIRIWSGKRHVAYVLRLTGHAVRIQGDLERAAGLYRQSLELFKETEDKWIATECIEGLAMVAGAQGKHDRAVRLFGAAESARETFGIMMPRPQAGDQEQFWAQLRERPDGTACAAAWDEGRAMTLEQAIEYAVSRQPA